jgi:hypothetical protein
MRHAVFASAVLTFTLGETRSIKNTGTQRLEFIEFEMK